MCQTDTPLIKNTSHSVISVMIHMSPYSHSCVYNILLQKFVGVWLASYSMYVQSVACALLKVREVLLDRVSQLICQGKGSLHS